MLNCENAPYNLLTKTFFCKMHKKRFSRKLKTKKSLHSTPNTKLWNILPDRTMLVTNVCAEQKI